MMRARGRSLVLSVVGLICMCMLLAVEVWADEVKESTTAVATAGVIRGRVLNGTTDEAVTGVEVILKRYEENQEQEQQKVLSDAQGVFSFASLDRRRRYSYILEIVYQGVEYYSPRLVFPDQSAEIPVEMTVYETTTSDQELSVVMHHILIEPREGALWVQEVMIVENRAKRAYVGSQEVSPDKKETLRVSLPSQAQDLELLQGLMSCCVISTDDGFVDTMAIRPGRKEVVFAYQVSYKLSSVELVRRLSLRTASLDVFLPAKGIQVAGEPLQYAGLMGEPGKQFLHFSGKDLAGGTQVVLKLSGLPWGVKVFKDLLPVVAVLLVAGGIIYPFLRRRKRSGAGVVSTVLDSSTLSVLSTDEASRFELEEERQRLLLSLASLDDQLEAGQIGVEEHERQRGEMKAKLIELSRALQS